MLVAALAILLMAAILYYWTGRRERRLMAQIPTPPRWPIVGHAAFLWTPLEEVFPRAVRWAAEFGPIFTVDLFGVTEVCVLGPDEIQSLLNSQENLTKSLSYHFIEPWLATGLLTSTGDKWRSRRKMLTPAFHYKNLEGFVDVFNANSAILVDKLGEHTADDYVEINDYVALCALDNLCETVMGTSVNAQIGEGVEYIRAVKRMCELFRHRHLSPWIHLDCIYRLTPSRREEKKVVQVLHDFSRNIIKKKRLEYNEIKKKTPHSQSQEEPKKRLSFLDMLMEMSDQEGKLTDDDIREEVDTFMFAGHDTTAAAISWTLFLLGAHKDIQDKVVAELSAIFGSDRRQPTTADLQNMTYLDMVMKESLRLFPSVSLYSRRIQTDLQIGEYTIPAGNNVMVFAYVLHRNPDIYPEPDRFDPERFSPEQSSGRHPCAYIPFSAGPRNCIGQKFARLEEKCVLSSVLRNFKLESSGYENLKVIPDVVLKSKEPIKIKIRARM